jgi:hypothetical protein
MRPTREYAEFYKCSRCGREKRIGGFYIPEDKKLHPDAYDDNGWPIGCKLP